MRGSLMCINRRRPLVRDGEVIENVDRGGIVARRLEFGFAFSFFMRLGGGMRCALTAAATGTRNAEAMMNKTVRQILRTSSLSLLCALAGGSAFAQGLPAPVERDGLTYLTGGVGEDEVMAFRQAAPKYNLRVTFSSKSGHYLSDIFVTLSRGDRPVLTVRTDGPFLFARVPAGRYKIVARDERVSQGSEVVVPERGGADVHLSFAELADQGATRACPGCPGRNAQP